MERPELKQGDWVLHPSRKFAGIARRIVATTQVEFPHGDLRVVVEIPTYDDSGRYLTGTFTTSVPAAECGVHARARPEDTLLDQIWQALQEEQGHAGQESR